MRIRAHTCYIGRTGYAAHARGFFRELSKYADLRVRNYTWDANPNYLNETDFKILEKITLNGSEGEKDWPIKEASQFFDAWKDMPFVDHDPNWEPDVDIVLMEQDHFYFYHEYKAKIKIAYMVWESTEVTRSFFDRILNNFDYFMVVSKWHKEMIVAQGYPEDRVIVVPEGVDEEFYPVVNPTTHHIQKKFQFLFFGRWDYRKAVPEILKAILEEFKNEDFEVILSADNPYSIDGMNSTEERLERYGLNDERIKVQHFLDRETYRMYMRTGNVLVTCARSEGWNIPLIEGLASGIPVTYSNWGAQLEFCEGKGNPVKVVGELPANVGADLGFAGNVPGNYCEPDFEDLKKVLRSIYDNWEISREKALVDSERIINEYNWESIGKLGFEKISKLERKLKPNPHFKVSFLDGPRLEILDNIKGSYEAFFIDRETDEIKFQCSLENNQWAACGIKYFTLWKIKVIDKHSGSIVFDYDFDPTGKRIYISIESSSLGDSIAWMSPVEEFRKKWSCEVYLTTFRNDLFASEYPGIKFLDRHEIAENPYVIYRIGWFYNTEGEVDSGWHKENFREIPMQKSATDILGIEHREIKTKIRIPEGKPSVEGKFVCIGIHGTAQAKYWNNEAGWQKLTNWLRLSGYKVVLISQEKDGYMGNKHPYGIIDRTGSFPLEDRIIDLKHAAAFIGIGSGLSWLAWAVGTPVVMISGFSEPYSEFECIRVINEQVCRGCFNRHRLDAGDWNWCPDHKDTPRQFECTKHIRHHDVIEAIKRANILEITQTTSELIFGENKYELTLIRHQTVDYLHLNRKSGNSEEIFYMKSNFGTLIFSIENSSIIELRNGLEWIEITDCSDVPIYRPDHLEFHQIGLPYAERFFSILGRMKILIERIEGTKIHYYLSAKERKKIKILVESESQIRYDHSMEMVPQTSYWTQLPGSLKYPIVLFIEEETGRILERVSLK
jgi:autotransporter strand-loop-strand O-heptosyltransferase